MTLLLVLLMTTVFLTLLLTNKLHKYWPFVFSPLILLVVGAELISIFLGLKHFFADDVLPRTCTNSPFSVCSADGGKDLMAMPRLIAAMLIWGALILVAVLWIRSRAKTTKKQNIKGEEADSGITSPGFHYPETDNQAMEPSSHDEVKPKYDMEKDNEHS